MFSLQKKAIYCSQTPHASFQRVERLLPLYRMLLRSNFSDSHKRASSRNRLYFFGPDPTMRLTLCRAFSLPQTPSFPPFLHSSPLASSPPPLVASPEITSKSRFCELNHLAKNSVGFFDKASKKMCFDFEFEIFCTILARFSFRSATSRRLWAYEGLVMYAVNAALRGSSTATRTS